MVLKGVVESGHGDAERWLSRFNQAYVRKTGIAIFPGSLNVRLCEPFDWRSERLPSPVIEFRREEYGGERDILLLPCVVPQLDDLRGFLWTTTNVVNDPDPCLVVEFIASVGVRDTFGVVDGCELEIELVSKAGWAPA